MEKEGEQTTKTLNELLKEETNDEELSPESIGKLLRMVFTLKKSQQPQSSTEIKTVENKDKNKKKVGVPNILKKLVKKKDNIPKKLRCPLSKKIMANPVILASGQTYDRSSLANWERSKNKKSPRSNKNLSHEAVTPNHSVQEVISKWCKSHDVQVPNRRNMWDLQTMDLDEDIFNTEVENMFRQDIPQLPSLAVKRLLQLLQARPIYQTLIALNSDVLPKMVKMISPTTTRLDPEMHKNMITVLLHISTDQKNRQELSKCETIIPVLIEALNTKNKLEMRCDTAAITYQLSLIYENKEVIGESDAFKLLIELLKEKWSPLANQDAMGAILSLCENEENVILAVKLGVVDVIAKKILDGLFVDELLPMLKFFSGYKHAVVMMVNSNDCLLPMLLLVARENPSDVNREIAVSILNNVIEQYPGFWEVIVMEIEQNREFVTRISQNGTPRAKTMANKLLESLTLPHLHRSPAHDL